MRIGLAVVPGKLSIPLRRTMCVQHAVAEARLPRLGTTNQRTVGKLRNILSLSPVRNAVEGILHTKPIVGRNRVWLCIHISQVPKAHVGVETHDNVVHQRYLEKLTGTDQVTGHSDVCLARFWDSGWVVVDEDDTTSCHDQCRTKH